MNKTLVERCGLHHYRRHDHHVYQNESLFPNYSLGVAPSTECGVTRSALAIYMYVYICTQQIVKKIWIHHHKDVMNKPDKV